MFWGFYTHCFSLAPIILSTAHPLLQTIAILWVATLYGLSFISYFETVRIGGGSPLDVSKSIKQTNKLSYFDLKTYTSLF